MERYNRRIKLYFSVLFSLLLMLIITKRVYADDATISISTTQAIQGEEVKVTINVSADEGIGECNFFLKYNPDVIEISEKQDDTGLMYNGGGGSIHVQYGVSNSKNVKITINFKAKAPGISEINYTTISEDSGVLSYESMEWMNVSYQNGSVTVKAPYVSSTDNYLSNLKVEAVKADGSTYTLNLSPAFSKDVTKYNANAVEGVTKLVITADKSDSKATVTMAGRNMDPGDNTTTITVTAEDGSTRKYVIYTFVEKKPETTTKPPEPIKVTIDGTEAYLKDIDTSVKLPEGFEKTEYQYKGEKVMAAKGLVKNLLIMYVAKEENDDGQLYIYDEASDTFYPMSNIQLTQKLYTIVKAPQDLIIPAGFVEATVTIDDQSFAGWSNSEIENIYLIYAMNWNGERGLYYYDTTEKQIIRYFDVTVQAGTSGGVQIDDYNKLLSQNENLKDEINKLKADNNKSDSGSVQLYKYLALGCCVMAIIYLGIIIYLVVSKKNEQTDENDSEELEADEDEDIIDEADEELDEELDNDSDNEAEQESDDADNETEDYSNDDSKVDSEDKLDNESGEKKSDAEHMIYASGINKVVLDKNDECDNALETEVNDLSLANDEQTDMNELLMDFEDIITSQTVAAIEDEEKANQQMQTEQENQLGEKNQEEKHQEEKHQEEKHPEEKHQEEKHKEEKQQKEKVHNDDTKKKVADIMEDDDSSIDSEDLDMVIDELFDDLFD